MKKYLTIALLALLSFPMWAEDQILQVWRTNGEVLSLLLEEQPITTFEDGNLVIASGSHHYSLPLETVKKYIYTDSSMGIVQQMGEVVTYTKDGIQFRGLKRGTDICVYAASGLLIMQKKALLSTEVVSVANQPAGTYLVKVNGVTYKIMKP